MTHQAESNSATNDSSDISVSVNGDKLKTPHSLLCDLLATLDTGDMFAVARNGEFVPKRLHATTHLSDGDTLDIVTPVGGG